jgi:hypothetical protein
MFVLRRVTDVEVAWLIVVFVYYKGLFVCDDYVIVVAFDGYAKAVIGGSAAGAVPSAFLFSVYAGGDDYISIRFQAAAVFIFFFLASAKSKQEANAHKYCDNNC